MSHLSPSSEATDPREPNGRHVLTRADDPFGDAVVFLIALLLGVAYYAAITVLKLVGEPRPRGERAEHAKLPNGSGTA
jgi:hypothetical protein